MSSRDKILAAIQAAKQHASDIPADPNVDQSIASQLADITPQTIEGLRDQFKEELEKISGEFRLVKSQKEMLQTIIEIFEKYNYKKFTITGDEFPKKIADQLLKKKKALECVQAGDFQYPQRKKELADIPVSIVDAAFAVADTATLCVPFAQTASHLPHVLPECIIAIIRPEQLVANHWELFEKLPNDQARNMVLISGASRTADIEKILFLGAHGPREFYVLYLET